MFSPKTFDLIFLLVNNVLLFLKFGSSSNWLFVGEGGSHTKGAECIFINLKLNLLAGFSLKAFLTKLSKKTFTPKTSTFECSHCLSAFLGRVSAMTMLSAAKVWLDNHTDLFAYRTIYICTIGHQLCTQLCFSIEVDAWHTVFQYRISISISWHCPLHFLPL